MKRHHGVLQLLIMFFFVIGTAPSILAEKHESKEKAGKVKLPPYVVNIGKENTIPHSEVDLSFLQPSDFTKELLETSKVKIENPNLIKILNESAINKSPFSIGVRATIFLGAWPLNYESQETNPNWQYQKINTNYFDNRGGNGNHRIHYMQETQKMVRGGLTTKVQQTDDVQKMMLLSAMHRTKLPLAFDTVIGAGTKHHQVYNVPPRRLGYLHAFVPAVHEKGQITYGEVYLVIKGTKRKIVVKNVTSQPIGAWIPVHSHLTLSFQGA